MEETVTISDGKTILMVPSSDPGEIGADKYLASLPLKPQNRYKFIRSIGFGGMKGVLLVHDRDTNREMAMAIMPDFREKTSGELERFAREAYLTANLEHPNIVPIYDIGIDESGSPFFTMKYLRGFSLDTLLQRLRKGDSRENQEYSLQRLLLIFHRICNAVGFAHTRGVCHLDLKPGNVNVSDFGETFVIDWGLARKMDAIMCAERGIDAIRINPGNIGAEENVKAVADICRAKNIPIRIGVNGGSLEKELLLVEGQEISLKNGEIPIPEIIFDYLKKGQQVLLDDGKILLRQRSF